MRKFRIILTAAIVAFAITSFVTVNAFADESEGYSEESSGFEAESNDSSSDSSSSEESHDEPASEPAASEPTASEDPAPAPAPAASEDSGSSSSDSSSDSGSSTEQPTIAPFYAEPIVTPVVVPTAPVVEEEPVAPKKTTKAVETSRKVVTPYEPPYLTEEVEEEIEEQETPAPTPVIEAGVLGEIEGAQEAPRKTPWGKIVAAIAAAILAGILILLAALYRPYKVVKVAETEDGNEEKSFISIKRAASFAATLLDSKDFERNFIGYEILKKRDDKDDEAKKIDRLIVKGGIFGYAKVVKANQKERQAVIDAGLIDEDETPSEQLSPEEAAAQWAEMATA